MWSKKSRAASCAAIYLLAPSNLIHVPTPMMGQVETEETENGNGKLKRKTEAESGNGKAEIGKWSSTFVTLMAPFAHARSVWG